MKEMLKKAFRSALSLMLVACLILGMSANGLIVLAAGGEENTNGNKTINYVSLGDSMTNGYGLEDYDHNSGVEDYGTGAYPDLFAGWLGEQGYDVDHAQLAMSGIRTEDIHWLLEFDYTDADLIKVVDEFVAENNKKDEVWNQEKWNQYFSCGDYWTVNEICNHSRTNATYYHIAGGAYESYMGCDDHGMVEDSFFNDIPDVKENAVTMGEKVAVIAKYYQEHVAAADIISLSIGNGNIGVFGFGRILEAIGFSDTETYKNYNYEDILRECEPEMRERLVAMIEEIRPAMEQKVNNEALVNVAIYIAVSLAMNYAGTVDAILQMNPDVEIILVHVMNTFRAEGAETEVVEGTALVELMELVVEPINAFIAGLPTVMQGAENETYKDAKFYYAEPEFVQCMVAEYEYPIANEIVRDRFVESIVGYCNCGNNCDAETGNPATCGKWKTGMIWDMLGDMVVPVTLSEIKYYGQELDEVGKLEYAAENPEKAMSISMYLAFEKSIVAGKDNIVTIESVLGLGAIKEGDPFGAIMEDFYAAAAVAGQEKLDVVAGLAAGAAGMNLSDVKALLGDEEAIKTLAWAACPRRDALAANTGHTRIEDVLACDICMNQGGHYYSWYIVDAYNDLMANPVYGYVALQSDGLLTGAQVKALYESNFSNEAIYAVVAEKSGGMLDAAEVATLDSIGVYEFAAAMIGGGFTAGEIEYAYNHDTSLLPSGAYGQIYGLHELYNGIQTLKADATKNMINDGVDAAKTAVTTVESLCTLLVMPEVLGATVAESELSGLLALFARCVIGNGLGAHPSAAGHQALAAAVIDAYGNNRTAAEKTLENVLYLITTYYDDAYAYAYAEAVKAGYIEEAVAYIDALIAEIEALNLDEVEMTDAFRAEANALRAEILATLGAAKALLIEADVLDQASLNALLALLNKAGNAMWQLTAVLEQAAIDVNQLAIIPALKAAHDELMNEVLPAIDAALQKAVAEGTAWLMAKTSQALKDLAQAAYELALEAAPEIADAVYDYLYNNPEEVIAFFAEYGDEMLYLVGEYGDEVLMVVAYVAYSYGPEIAEFVIENHETILKAMINWLEVHGENTAALLQVYAEALGLCDAVREQIEILENAVIELNKQAEAQIAILEAEIAALKAQLENASAELKAEIEAKIAELEAQIEMLKAEVAAKIAEVKAAIAELEAALQAAIEKGLADMAALKEAIENLDEKVLELIAAAKKTAIEEIIAATEKVQAALENLDATVEELAGEVYEELKDLLANAVDALIEATIEAAKKYAPEIADAIYNYLYNNPEEVIAFFTEYGDEMLALVEEYGDEALMVIGYFLYLYGEDIAEFVIENHEEILAGICAWIDVHGENTAALLQVYAETLGLCDAVRDQIADLEAKLEELQAELEELKAQLENAANELNEEILAQIEKVEQEIAKVEKALEELKEQLEELYNQIVEIAEAIKEVAEAIKNLNDIIEGKIEGSINEAIDNVQDALEHLADVLVAVEELVEQINEMIDELQEIGEKIDNAINEMIETVEEIKAAIEELNEKVEETIAKIEAAIEEIEKAADELIAEAETALEALKEMAEELKDAVNAAIEDLIAKVREAYENAIRADYEIDRKSYYVGIGDDSAVADGYVEKLAEALGMTERFNNLAQEGLTVEDAFALIQEEMAEIAKADLITIGFNNVAATTNMFNTIAGMGKVDTDWMGLLGAEYTTYVDEALAEINAKLLEEGLDEATAALLTEAVNAYAYTYASRELYYPELVNAIHEISPEALVVIVGTYNDLEGVVLDMGGTEIAVGEYVQYLIDAANLQNLIYAMLTENTIYVDAPAVDTLFEEAVAEGSINVVGPQTYIFALMMGYMNPSETGHEYIKDQILNALNVTRATKLGDVNHDGLVDVEDAMLIQQYDAFLVGEEDLDLSVADVSGDGVVDVEDAMLIQQYDAFIIDVFPAEEEA